MQQPGGGYSPEMWSYSYISLVHRSSSATADPEQKQSAPKACSCRAHLHDCGFYERFRVLGVGSSCLQSWPCSVSQKSYTNTTFKLLLVMVGTPVWTWQVVHHWGLELPTSRSIVLCFTDCATCLYSWNFTVHCCWTKTMVENRLQSIDGFWINFRNLLFL